MKVYDPEGLARALGDVSQTEASAATEANGRRHPLWRLIQLAHALMTVASVPMSILLALVALMAESGGKNSHPWVLPFLAWGVVELVWTHVALSRAPGLGPHVPASDRRLLVMGSVLTLLIAPGLIITIGAGGGSEWSFVWPYVVLAAGCWITRHALKRIGVQGPSAIR
jgi:hypothetical protein